VNVVIPKILDFLRSLVILVIVAVITVSAISYYFRIQLHLALPPGSCSLRLRMQSAYFGRFLRITGYLSESSVLICR